MTLKNQEWSASFTSIGRTPPSALSLFEKQHFEDIPAQNHDIFARHRFDIDTNRELFVKLTPNDDRPAYSQGLPTPINLNVDITVELALLHRHGIITTIFAQRKPNRSLRLWIDLRKFTNLITQDYVNNNHRVGKLTDAAQHMFRKKLLCKRDCSQAYNYLQMAIYPSIQMLAFTFASRTFAYRRLARGLSRSVYVFSSVIRECLDKAIKVYKCEQNV